MKAEFFNKAKENLKAAEILFNRNLFSASASRTYFAAFQAAIAALAHTGIYNENYSHKWVQSAFNRELIHQRKIYPGKIKSYLLEMQNIRIQADYTTKSVSKKKTKELLSFARIFVELISKELNK